MRRRDFIAISALAAVGAGNSEAAKAGEDKPAKNELVEKAKMAMLCMQRASWEQGTA